jgi:AcrB/AcrD/AcrF family
MGIVRFELKFPHTFFVLAALILVLGVSAILSMPTDIFPEINIPVVTVIWQETGLSIPEMEQRVTTYSQYWISTSVNGIRDIEAQTLNGISIQPDAPAARADSWRDAADPCRGKISPDHGRHRPSETASQRLDPE